MKQIEKIQQKCDQHNINIYDVFREAKIPTATIQNWRTKEPSAFETLEKINKTLETIISEKTAVAVK